MRPSDPAHRVLSLFPGKFKLVGVTPEIETAIENAPPATMLSRYIEITGVNDAGQSETEFTKTMPGIKNKFGTDIRSVVAVTQVFGSSTRVIPALLADRGLIFPADSGPNDYWLWQLPASADDPQNITISYSIATRVPAMSQYAVATKV